MLVFEAHPNHSKSSITISIRRLCNTKHKVQPAKSQPSLNQKLKPGKPILYPSNVLTHFQGLAPAPARHQAADNSHILIVLSKLPLTRSLPFGANATLYKLSLRPSAPLILSTRYPVLASQTRILLSDFLQQYSDLLWRLRL